MDSLYILQHTCFIFMVINALLLAGSRLNVRWKNARYEQSRIWLIVAMLGLAAQYLLQMMFGFRNDSEDLGAVVNILIYTPCFSLISLAIYNIEATHRKRRKMLGVCGGIYLAIVAVLLLGLCLHENSSVVGGQLYWMLALFGCSVVYCIYMIVREMMKRKQILKEMTASDILPFVRYARASLFILCLAAFVMPFAILSTTLLYIVGPFALLAILFFTLNFIALGYSYTPTEELIDEEMEKETEMVVEDEVLDEKEKKLNMPAERIAHIQAALGAWCQAKGYKDNSVNMLSLSRELDIPKEELTQYFDQCLGMTFRLWLSDIRFKAAKEMMMQQAALSNDFISAECGFSSRSHLYRIFKAREGCSPSAWLQSQNCK